MKDVTFSRDQDAAIDYTPTHLVTRISSGSPAPLTVFFNPIGRSLSWNPADASEEPGSSQGVPACVAEAIAADEGLASHFRVELLDRPADAPARSTRRRSEPAA